MGASELQMSKFKRILVYPFKGLVKAISPTLFVKCEYKHMTHHKLNLKNPVRYTEKLQYLRLFTYPKDPDVIRCASRDSVREYIKELGLEEILIPIYGVYKKFDDIDFSKLPDKFVMKCTHACAFNEIVLNKNLINKNKLRKKFNKWLRTDYGKKTMERHYSFIKPRIIIEEYIGELDELPLEYKIHVFNGVARSMYVVSGRGKDIRYNNYYIDWKPFDGSQFNGWKKSENPIKSPANWEEMVKISQKLAANFPFVRVDLYNINGKIYFGEMTFTPAKGTLKLDDDKCDFEMGEWLKI